MRGSGPKGIAQKRERVPEVSERVSEAYDPGVLAIYTYQGSYAYAPSEGLYKPDIQPLPLGEYGYTLDLGEPAQLGYIGDRDEARSEIGDTPIGELWWSHDRVRWYKHYSGVGHNSLEYSSDGELWRQVRIPQPTQLARYWKVIHHTSTTVQYLASVTRVMPIIPRNPDIVADVSLHNRMHLDTGSLYAALQWELNAYCTGHHINFNFQPDMVLNHSNTEMESGFNTELYNTTEQYIRGLNSSATNPISKYEISQLTKTGIVFGIQIEKLSTWDNYHPNSFYYGGLFLSSPTYWLFAAKHDLSRGVSVLDPTPDVPKHYDQDKWPHNLGKEPALVFMRYGYNSRPIALWRDIPNNYSYIEPGYTNQERNLTWSHDVDDEFVYYSSLYTPSFTICFDDNELQGIKSGTYVGNGSSSGPTITGLGFQPTYLLVQRDVGLALSKPMVAGTYSGDAYDVFSGSTDSVAGGTFDMTGVTNGFQVTSTNENVNFNGATYAYIAFKAETEFG